MPGETLSENGHFTFRLLPRVKEAGLVSQAGGHLGHIRRVERVALGVLVKEVAAGEAL